MRFLRALLLLTLLIVAALLIRQLAHADDEVAHVKAPRAVHMSPTQVAALIRQIPRPLAEGCKPRAPSASATRPASAHSVPRVECRLRGERSGTVTAMAFASSDAM